MMITLSFVTIMSVTMVAAVAKQNAFNDIQKHCENINHENGGVYNGNCSRPIKVNKRIFTFIDQAGMEIRFYIVPLQGGRYHYVYIGQV